MNETNDKWLPNFVLVFFKFYLANLVSPAPRRKRTQLGVLDKEEQKNDLKLGRSYLLRLSNIESIKWGIGRVKI